MSLVSRLRPPTAARSGAAAVGLALLFALLAAGSAPAAPGYYRTPDLHGGTVVFAAEGDLWTVPVTGGTATRLTSDEGDEWFPRFSPDGSMVAFSGEYDGNRDVFVVAATGGEPRRLTWHPGVDEVLGWTPDGTRVLFRSSRNHPHGSQQAWTVPVAGGEPELVPLGRVARVAIDPVSGRWAMSRTNRERSTWKRYRGGTASEIWVGSGPGGEFRPVTNFDGVDMMPMWREGRIWFVSDRGGTYNLWSMLPDGTDRRRHTDRTEWDVRWPAIGDDGRIVLQSGADLVLFDPGTGTERPIPVELPSERVLTRQRYPDAGKYLETFALSPDGERLAIVARGEIFSVPVEEGVTLPVTRGSGARERGVAFGPKGERLFFLTDASGEESIRSVDAWGRGDAKVVVPAGETGWHFPPAVSPDGKRVAWADQTFSLWVADADGGSPKRVDRSPQEEIRTYVWSPDGRWLAYARQNRIEYSSIRVYDTRSGETHAVTGDDTNDYSPAWDPDGRWLAFLSDRTSNPLLGQRDFEYVDIRPTRPYLALLRKDVENPFRKADGMPPATGDDKKKDEKKDRKKKDEKKDDEEKDEDAPPEPVEIEWDGIAARIVEVPVDAGNYGGLGATADRLFWFDNPIAGMQDESEGPTADLVSYSFEDEESDVFVAGVTAYDLVPKAGKIAVQKKRGQIHVVDAGSAPKELDESKVSLDDVVIELHPRDEWRQIYFEGWRQMRDFFWTPNMGGVDWTAVRDRYATLLPRLATRSDLSDVMGEVLGELATSHTYRWGGDPGRDRETVPTGLLGADLVRQGDAVRVQRILRGAPADRAVSPLDEPGVDVSEGDWILAVNGRPLLPGVPFHANLENLAGRPVLLTVNGQPSRDGAREVMVTPIANEGRLRYVDWVRRERERVAERTGGKIAYIHLPDMGTPGLTEFTTWFYPQLDKEGMIVDCRWNGGGFVSQMILERFRRSIVSIDRSRGGGTYTYPWRALNGPFVVLTNEEAGSDGDIFPYAVQYDGLAPVLGTRSWGGVVGIRGDKLLVDGGIVTHPEYAWWDPRRGWAIENHGVDPDIVVDNLPHEVGRGIDSQLERGIDEVLRLRAERPPLVPDFDGTPIPDKSREAFRKRELE